MEHQMKIQAHPHVLHQSKMAKDQQMNGDCKNIYGFTNNYSYQLFLVKYYLD